MSWLNTILRQIDCNLTAEQTSELVQVLNADIRKEPSLSALKKHFPEFEWDGSHGSFTGRIYNGGGDLLHSLHLGRCDEENFPPISTGETPPKDWVSWGVAFGTDFLGSPKRWSVPVWDAEHGFYQLTWKRALALLRSRINDQHRAIDRMLDDHGM